MRLAILPIALAVGSMAQPGFPADPRMTDRPYAHLGGGAFAQAGATDGGAASIDLRQVEHRHDPAENPDVPLYTDVTLPGETPPLRDAQGRDYALITL
jgi:hypothetical protein